MPNCLHKVCLAQSHSSINEKRVVDHSRLLGNRSGGSVRKLVIFPYHKRLESIAGIEAVFVHAAHCMRGCRFGRGFYAASFERGMGRLRRRMTGFHLIRHFTHLIMGDTADRFED